MSGRYDLVVIGGGTAGLVSSVIAAGTGARVALVERERTGGDCLWTGCVPSKTLIASARLAHRMRHADRFGLRASEPDIDFAAVMDRVHETIAEIEPHDSPERPRSEGVEVIAGDASFRDARTVEVAGRSLRFRSAIIATGSEPAVPPVEGLAAALAAGHASTTETIWNLRELPRRLAVLGGGPIGCELGQAFARLGSRVTIVELGERLLPAEEPEAGLLIAERLRAEGVEVRLGAGATAVGTRGGQCMLELSGPSRPGRDIEFDHLLVATGRRPRSTGIGLAGIGVEIDQRGAVAVDRRLRTSVRGIYGAGDVTAELPFTHVAAHHARIATVNALFGARREVSAVIPRVTFTDPEVASVGIGLAGARERWSDRASTARSDYADLDRAITEGEAQGFAMLIGDPKGRLVGATIAAPGAGEAIAELTAWASQGAKIDAVSSTVHAYPTLAEGPSRAADEYLRARYAKPGYRALGKLALRVRRLLPRG
ncbi:FAD-dependent oxidoreductase [soil metagenome]